jgi:pectate lyase
MIGYNKDNLNKPFEIHAGYDNESIHWSFQRHGYPAIVVSEDCFVNDANQDPKEDSNLITISYEYYTKTDKSFAADIAIQL